MHMILAAFSLYSFLWYFAIYSFLGWCTEVAYAALQDGRFVNRGFLNGPVCPIYGFGVSLVVGLLMPVKSNLFLLFLGAMVLVSALEWITGFVLEKVFQDRWWDYSDQPFNLGGYICLKFSILWGLACVMIVELFHPLIEAVTDWIPLFPGQILIALILLLFAADTVATAASVLNMNKQMRVMQELTDTLRETSDLIGENISEGVLELSEKRQELMQKQSDLKEDILGRQKELKQDILEKQKEWKEELLEKQEGLKQDLQEVQSEVKEEWEYRQAELKAKYNELMERYENLAGTRKRILRRMMRAFPKWHSKRYAEQFREIRKRYDI